MTEKDIDRIGLNIFRDHGHKIALVVNFIVESGLDLLSYERNKRLQTDDFTIESEGKAFIIHAVIRSIGESGWSDKKDIKRVQISSYKDLNLPVNSDQEMSTIFGLCTVDSSFIICSWNLFQFMTQKTNRSCYVKAQDLIDAKIKGFAYQEASSTPYFVSDIRHFGYLIENFLKYNKINLVKFL